MLRARKDLPACHGQTDPSKPNVLSYDSNLFSETQRVRPRCDNVSDYPVWKLALQGSLGVAAATWNVLHLTIHIQPSTPVAVAFSVLTALYVAVDFVHAFKAYGALSTKIFAHHTIMTILPWFCVFQDIPVFLWYVFMHAGSTEIGVVAFYFFLRHPGTRCRRLLAIAGLLQRTFIVVNSVRMIVIHNQSLKTAYPFLSVIFVAILAMNQYYTFRFYRKYVRVLRKLEEPAAGA